MFSMIAWDNVSSFDHSQVAHFLLLDSFEVMRHVVHCKCLINGLVVDTVTTKLLQSSGKDVNELKGIRKIGLF